MLDIKFLSRALRTTVKTFSHVLELTLWLKKQTDQWVRVVPGLRLWVGQTFGDERKE